MRLIRPGPFARPHEGNGEAEAEAEAEAPALSPISSIQLVANYPTERPIRINHLAREGSVAVVVSGSKAMKTYCVLDLAVTAAAGGLWLDTFEVPQTRVLLIDNELHAETLAERLKQVVKASGYTIEQVGPMIDVLPLRGNLKDINHLGHLFYGIKPGYYGIITLDAAYRAYPPEMNENDNAGVAQFFNTLDAYAKHTRAAIVLTHHASKGHQGDKNPLDVGAGAGSASRAADAIVVMRPHEEPDCIVLESVVRTFPPIAPSAYRWTFPRWRPDATLDATKLRRDPRRGGRPRKDQVKADIEKAVVWTPDDFTKRFVTDSPVAKELIIAKAAMVKVSRTNAINLLMVAEDQRLVYRHEKQGDNKVYYATTEPDLTMSVCVSRPPRTPQGARRKTRRTLET